MPQAEVTARSLRLQWVPGNDGASPVRFFSLQLRELPAGTWHTYPASLGHDATSCQVERYGLGSALLSHPEGLPISSWASSPQAPPHTHTLDLLHFRLRPFTSYKLRLRATNDIGDSDYSAETEAVTTLQDGE